MNRGESRPGSATAGVNRTAAASKAITGILTSSIDLVLVLAIALFATATTLLEAPAGIRVPLGILLVLFLPGYALVSALFPSNDGPDGVARIALGVALALAAIPPLALAIDRSPWRIARTSVTVGLLAITIAALLAAAILRRRLAPTERYAVAIRHPTIRPPLTWSREQRLVALALGVAGLLFVVGGYDAVRTRLTGSPLTEFALYNAAGEAQFYPRDIEVGEPASVQIGVTNREGTTVTYRIAVAGAGVAVDPVPDVTLADGEAWQGPIRFTVTTGGADLPVRFELYRTDRQAAAEPYRILVLVVDGHASAGTPS